ncbi:MAG: condensation domain-containing protein [Acutalibacteraceae bacterium]
MKKEFPYKLYDLIPSQETMYLMVKYSFSKQLTQIPTSFSISEDLDFDLLTKALNIEFERNDSLRIRFKKVDKKLQQYFLPSFKMNKVPCKYFRSIEQQKEFLGADAQVPVYFLKDECFRIIFFKTLGVGSGVYFNVSHLNMDALGAVVFYLDLMGIYMALKKGKELPAPLYSYEEYIQQELEVVKTKKKFDKHEKWYRKYFEKGGEPFYAGVHGPAFLEKMRVKKKNPNLRVPAAYNPLLDKCNMIQGHIGTEDAAKIFAFCKNNNIAPESLFMMGLRTHCSAINYRTNDVFMMATCSKRATVKEKRMSGCLVQPVQVRTIINEDQTFMDGLKEYTRVRTQLYRHLDYPYITARDLSREMYNYSLIQGPACMMFSWIPVPTEFDFDVKFDFQTYDLGRYFTPLYTICSPDPKDKGINLNYMYRVKLSKKEQIEALHKNAVKVILTGIENPDITVKELLDMCEA